MIYVSRTATIAPGKLPAATVFAREVAGYIKTATGVEVKIGMPIGGNPHRISWFSQHESLAAYEATTSKILSDAKYLEIIGKAAEYFVAGSLHDDIHRLI